MISRCAQFDRFIANLKVKYCRFFFCLLFHSYPSPYLYICMHTMKCFKIYRRRLARCWMTSPGMYVRVGCARLQTSNIIPIVCMCVCMYRGCPSWRCSWDRAFQLGLGEGPFGLVGPISQPLARRHSRWIILMHLCALS